MHKLTEKRGGRREGAGRKVDTFRALVLLAFAKGHGIGLTRARAVVREYREKILDLRAIAKSPEGKKVLAERMDEYVKRRLEEGFDQEYEVKRYLRVKGLGS